MNTFEVWKDIPSLGGKYSASSFGRIKSNDRLVIDSYGRKQPKTGRILLPRENRGGYLYLTVTPPKGSRKSRTVHSLVGEAFGIRDEKLVCNHVDGNKHNNRVENLEWVSCKRNIQHAWEMGLSKPSKGELNGASKLTADEVANIRALYSDGMTQKKIGAMFGMSQTGIGKIVRGELWV